VKSRVAVPLPGGGAIHLCIDPKDLTPEKVAKLQEFGERLLRRPELEESSAVAWRRWVVAR
jgi:hypothetical protein